MFSKYQMVREIYSLASGTLAKLFGVVSYSALEGHVHHWMRWIVAHSADKRWETWQDCWEEYKRERG